MFNRKQDVPSPEIDRRSLSGLYPVAKTYAERAAEDEARQVRILQRQPKLARFKLSLYTSSIIAIILLYVQIATQLWKDGVNASMIISFGLALVILLAAIGCIVYAHKLFYIFNRAFLIFIVIEAVLVAIVICALPYAANALTDAFTTIGFLSAIHFVVLYSLLVPLIRYERVV